MNLLRPRERFIEKGGGSLSDTELLSILLGAGQKGLSSYKVAENVLRRFHSIGGLLQADYQCLVEVPGVGRAKALSIMGLRELISRYLKERVDKKVFIKDLTVLKEYLSHTMGRENRETFRVLFLNKNLRLLVDKNLFIGTVDEAVVYPQEIIREALRVYASHLILVHNHPSGNKTPSPQDIKITEKIQKAAEMFSVRVIDHIIVTDEGCLSFADEDLL